LQFIGEQLWEDAAHLVRTYPANAPKNWRRAFAAALVQRAEPPHSPGRTAIANHVKIRPAAFGGVVAATVAAVIAVGWYSAQLSRPTGTSGSAGTARRDHPDVPPGRIIAAETQLLPGLRSSWWGPDTLSRPTVVVPAGAETFDYFSPPEQEAILDVWTKNRIPEGNVKY
jgi:hypothetical protein